MAVARPVDSFGSDQQLAIARMKIYYDSNRRTPPKIEAGHLVYVKLAKPGHPGYHLNNQTKLSHRRCGPFTVEAKINDLRYRVRLPDYLQWKPEFSIEHLEPAVPGTRTPEPLGPLNQDRYIIESILDTRQHDGQRQYQVQWLGYPEPT